MTEFGEKIVELLRDILFDNEKPQGPTKDQSKKVVRVRCSLFFDGTQNNRINIEEREKNTRIYQERSNKKDDSYVSGRTNIALMEPWIQTITTGADITIKAYVEGPGTTNFESDSLAGLGLGIGDTGVKKKVEKGIVDICNQFIRLGKSRIGIIEKLTLDVFGFSRGAACARFAVWELLKHGDRPIHERLRDAGFEISESSVEVDFVGLYDTVSSHGVSFANDTKALRLDSIQGALRTVHLVAADEYRKKFQLTNIRSAGTKGTELYLPGSHSDIGGGYLRKIDEDFILRIGRQAEVSSDRSELVSAGWFRDPELTESVFAYTEWGAPMLFALRAQRKGVRYEYSRIPLKIMCRFARKNGLKIGSSLDSESSAIIESANLTELEDKISEYVGSTQNSRVDDWNQDPIVLSIRHDFLHFSATGGFVNEPRFRNGRRNRGKPHDG